VHTHDTNVHAHTPPGTWTQCAPLPGAGSPWRRTADACMRYVSQQVLRSAAAGHSRILSAIAARQAPATLRIQAHGDLPPNLANIGQTANPQREYSQSMTGLIRMLTTELDGDDGLIVTFSDGTTGAYVIEELLGLRPIRERAKTKKTKEALRTK
jgi:hypothetical protein